MSFDDRMDIISKPGDRRLFAPTVAALVDYPGNNIIFDFKYVRNLFPGGPKREILFGSSSQESILSRIPKATAGTCFIVK